MCIDNLVCLKKHRDSMSIAFVSVNNLQQRQNYTEKQQVTLSVKVLKPMKSN